MAALSVLMVTFLAELPDKTSLAALTLAARHRAFPVWVGAMIGFAAQTAIAVTVGHAFSRVPPAFVRAGSGLLFLGFAAYYAWGFWRGRTAHRRGDRSAGHVGNGQARETVSLAPARRTAREDDDEEDDADDDAARIAALRVRTRQLERHVILQAAVIIFLAEFGDLTQVALVAFAARLDRPFLVFGAGLLALGLAAGVSTWAGQRLGHFLSPARMQVVAAAAMGLMGALTLLGLGFV